MSNSTRRLFFITLFLSLVLLAGLFFYSRHEAESRADRAATASRERVQRGRVLYVENCAACHGLQGKGGIGRPLNDRKVLINTSDEIYASVIRSGVPGTQMAAWGLAFGGALTDEDIRDLTAFIRAWEPTAVDVQPTEIPPSPQRGAALFAEICAPCHSEPLRLTADSLLQLGETIAYGRPAQGMPAWGGALTTLQLADLQALLAAWQSGESVQPAFDIAQLLAAADFALLQADFDSALLRLQQAQSIAGGAAGERLAAIAALVRANETEAARAAIEALRQDWPIGDAERGAQVFASHCATCHGENGEGDEGVPLKPNEFVGNESSAGLYSFLLVGRPSTAMVGFGGRLTESQLADVIAFIKGWSTPR